MLNFFLYAGASLIWGSTWLAIKLQLTQVPPILSVAYRFCLAAFILLAYCRLTGKRLNFSLRDHQFMVLQGFTLFGLSYCGSYLATAYMTSGLVAVVFSTILLAMDGRLTMNWSIDYLGPLLYLTIFGSILAFGFYMLLINRIGAEYAAYVTLLMPIIALILSTLFEGYRWTSSALAGVALVLAGNLIILTPQAAFRRFMDHFKGRAVLVKLG